jgi:uncharacterized protein YeaC (DUF1315 family)
MSDNLTKIKSIGSEQRKWLNEIEIHTCTELAETNPNSIFKKLKTVKTGDKPPASLALEDVKRWVEEAKTKSVAHTAQQLSESATNVLPFKSQNNNALTEEGWDNFATFFVAYQHKHHVEQKTQAPCRTIVYRTTSDHIEDNDCKQWDGIEGDDLGHWILEHVNKLKKEFTPEEEKITAVQAASTEHESANCELIIEGVELQDHGSEITDKKDGAHFLSGIFSSDHPLTITPILNVSPTDSVSFTWKVSLILYISKMPKGQLLQESQRDLHFSSIAEVQHRHSFPPVQLAAGFYCIQVSLLTEEPHRKLVSSKEYTVQML